MVKMWVANTDPDWFDFLAAQPDIDEVNFWQPSGGTRFGAIQPGELFLFKLKSPRNAIGGFGVLDRANSYPLSLAWEALGIKNGARTLQEMRARVDKYRRDAPLGQDYAIGCRIVVQPVFFPRELWIPQPDSWSRQIVTGKAYDTAEREGRALWDRLMEAAQAAQPAALLQEGRAAFLGQGERYGAPRLVKPRRGQGAFRLAVTDAYGRQCAISEGKVLPALEAAHIRSYAEGGEHEVSNGLLLRRDIHSVFDAGYITFEDDLTMVVSDKVRTVFNNGNEYRRLQGHKLRPPADPALGPNLEHLRWHREERFERFVA